MKWFYYKKLREYLLLVLLLLAIVACINFWGDGGFYFARAKTMETNIANALVKHKKVLICTNFNDRKVKKLLIQQLTASPDILILGSSRIMPVRADFFHSLSFFNAGVPTATLEDDIALYYLLQQRGFKPKKILIGLDPWLIDSSHSRTLWRMTFLSDFPNAERMFFNIKNKMPILERSQYVLQKYTQLLSPNYLRESLRQFKNHSNIIVDPNSASLPSHAACYFYLVNGTRLTSIAEEMTTPKQADYAGAIEMHHYTPETVTISQAKKALFEKFIAYLVNQNIQVIFYLPPYESAAYQEIINLNYVAIHNTEDYFHAIADQYGLKVIGSYNPNQLGLTAKDFFDELHAKTQTIDKIFMAV